MLWIIIGEASHEIISCNTCEKDGMYQVWIERPNGKTMKIGESKKEKDVKEVKDAIDWAIEHGYKTLNLN